MMNSLMNFMPLTVIFFGWTFAAGPVLYWATQSVYSVVQQWLITGWGSLREWVPWLPEMPEHRRLGYRPPRSEDDPVVVSGDRSHLTGFSGWLQRWMEAKTSERMEMKAQQRAERSSATAPEEPETAPNAASPVVVTGQGKSNGRRGRTAPAADRKSGAAAADAEAAERARSESGSRAVVIQRGASSGKSNGTKRN
jgi:YidC/Oxa1 family membrane protein insertase